MSWLRRARRASLALSLTVGASPLHAQSTPSHPRRPALQESFSASEIGLTIGAIFGTVLLNLRGEAWIGAESPRIDAPEEGAIDLRFSRWANPHFTPGQQWLGGAPDLAGYALPAAGAIYYLGGSLLGGEQGTYGAYPHEAIAFTEGLSWAMFTTTLLKHLTGRERPYVVRGRLGELDASAVKMRASERRLSFPSGHSTAVAATSFFLAADLSDALVSGPLQAATPSQQALLGRVLPYLGASALTWVVMYSRIRDQRHWLSDTLVGTSIGALSALLSYHIHFDQRGQPRRR